MKIDFKSIIETAVDNLSEGKLYATSKDGVRKAVMNDAHAAEWRDTVAKPPKKDNSAARAATKEAAASQLRAVSRIVQNEVSNGYPDTDGFDFILPKLKKMYPQMKSYEYMDLINKAVKTHLGAKDFHAYVDTFGEMLK